MISDVLCDAVRDIDEYLDGPLYQDAAGAVEPDPGNAVILALRDRMHAVRVWLDRPPGPMSAADLAALCEAFGLPKPGATGA